MKGVVCRDLSAGRRGQLVVSGLEGALEPGTVCALLGANGAGKSTLLEALAGGPTLMSGTVSLDGQLVAGAGATLPRVARLRAYLPQQHGLSFPLRVDEVVMLGRRPHSGSRRQHLAVVNAALAAVDAIHLAQRRYTELSGGERQRVQLARVMAQVWEPMPTTRLLLLDEPTAGLDLGHQQLLLRQLRIWTAGGGVVIAALHDLNLALSYSDRVWALSAGRLVSDGPPAAVLSTRFVYELVGAEVVIESAQDSAFIRLID